MKYDIGITVNNKKIPQVTLTVGVGVCLGGGEIVDDSTGGGGEVEGGEIGAAGGVSWR